MLFRVLVRSKATHSRTSMNAFIPYVDLSNVVPLDKTVPLKHLLSLPPFVDVEGSFNVRRLSLPPSIAIFRGGDLSNLSQAGYETLHRLGVKKVYDLRGEEEQVANPLAAVFASADGDGPGGKIEVISLAKETVEPRVVAASERGQRALLRKQEGLANGTLLAAYHRLFLISHAPVFAVILRQLLRDPATPILFHCTAGKDRTGLMAILLHSLAGLPADQIALEHALTRLGIEPAREFLTHMIAKWVGGGPSSAAGPATEEERKIAAAKKAAMQSRIEQQGATTRQSALDVLAIIESEWNGVDRYLVEQARLDEAEVSQLRGLLSG